MFYHLADQLQDMTKGAIGVNWAGESTLHPKFIEYAKYLNKKGFKIALPTNGSMLSNALFQVDLAWIQVYLDKSTEDFARRSTLNYEQHINRILNFTKEWMRNSSTFRLRYFIQKTKKDAQNEANLQAKYDFLKKFAAELGLADKIKFDFSNRVIAEHKKTNGAVLQFGQMPILSGGIFPSTEDNPAVDFQHKNRNFGSCDSAWKHTKITNDGCLTLCCQALEGKTIFSKPEEIWKRSIKDLWLHHEEVERYRSHMIRGELIYDVCRQCLDAFPARELYHPHHLIYEKQVPMYTFGDVVRFDSNNTGDKYARHGFAPPTHLTWSISSHATLSMKIEKAPFDQNWKLVIMAVVWEALDHSDRNFFEILINGKKVSQHSIVHRKLHQYVAEFSGAMINAEQSVNIEFVMSDRPAGFLPISPANMPRIGLQSIVISSAD
jgi:MoaA/NifB/PqqE/SkfB family radical SAM enzyme